MARDTAGNLGDYLSRASSLIGTADPRPISIHLWFKANARGRTHNIYTNNFNAANPACATLLIDAGGGQDRQRFYSGAFAGDSNNFVLSITDWTQLGWTWTAAGNAVGYFYNGAVNGVSALAPGGAATDGAAWGTLDGVTVGYESDGYFAEMAVWNAILTADEFASLAAGYCPLFIRPQSLVSYVPCIGRCSPEIDGVNSTTWTVNGTMAVRPHSPVLYPAGASYGGLPAAPPPSAPPAEWTGGTTVPSLHETLGLSVAYADPLVKSPRAAYIGELRREVTTYEHETAAIGGYLTARFDMAGDMVDVNDWFERGVGRHVEVTGPDLTVLWEGFVNSVAVSAGQYAATRGPLVEICNRVYAVYSERDTSVDPPTVIPGQITTIAQDTTSQGRYGIWEKRISAGEDTALGAQRQRDSFLRENKEPTTDDPRVVLEAGGQVSVAVECLGYWAWLLAYPYLDTAGSGTVTAQTKVQYILAADTNGVFSVNYSHVGYNPDLAPRYENSGAPAWEVMKALTARGDANDNRWLFGLYAGREAYYRQAPTVEKYQHRLADPAQRIETIIGDEVAPWDVRPGEWVYLPDFLTGRGQPVVAADKRDDPRFLFVEAVRYRAPYSAEITGTRVGRLAQILAKKGVGGGGG